MLHLYLTKGESSSQHASVKLAVPLRLTQINTVNHSHFVTSEETTPSCCEATEQVTDPP